MSNDVSLDAIDHEILLRLSENGRISNARLAEAVGLTPAPCLRRVQRLEREGVIRGYSAQIDPAALGRSFEVIVAVEITLSKAQTVADFEAAIAAFDEVTEAWRLMGRPDYFLRVHVEDVHAYEAFTMDKLSRLPAVDRIKSHQSMRGIVPRR